MTELGGHDLPSKIIFCHPSMRNVTRRMEETITSRNKTNSIRFLDSVQWDAFEDGYPDIFINEIENCANKDIIYMGSFHSPSVIFEQLSVLYALPRSSIRSLTFILPYFPTGTMERVDTEGQIATASTMARLLSATPLTTMGPTQLFIYDIHALQERFYFTDHVIPRLLSAIPRFLTELRSVCIDKNQIAIAFPDEGAHKRFSTYFGGYPIIRCIKRREGAKREVTIVDGSAKGRHVVIVDDLIRTGGTVLKCVDCLKKAEASKVSVYVTHAVFPRDSWKSFTSNGNEHKVVDTFWITDSLPQAEDISKHKPFKLISLANSICDALGV